MATVVDTSKKILEVPTCTGGETVKLFNDEAFKKVRKFRNVADDAISPLVRIIVGKTSLISTHLESRVEKVAI